jgi:hypothetical protein
MTSPKAVADHLAKFSTQAERARLDEQPHFIPINLNVFKLTLGSVIVQNVEQVYDAETIETAKQTYPGTWKEVLSKDSVISLQELKTTIENYVVSRHKNRIDISGSDVRVNGKINTSLSDIIDNCLPATVYSNNEVVGALYGSYKKAYSGFFKEFLNKEISKFINKIVYKDSNYKIGFDVGHILGNTELANTPLGQKLRKILDVLGGLTEGTLNIEGISQNYISSNKQSIVGLKTQIDGLFNKLATGNRYGPQIEAEIKKDVSLNNLLVSLKANIVIAQDRYENQAVYAGLLEGPLGAELIKLLETVNFSNNLVEQIAENIALTIAGKKIVSSKKKVSVTKAVPKKPVKVNLITKPEQNISVKNLPKYRSKAAVVTLNLINLQNLINRSLTERVKANMGRGERRDVLNLRTGRFAESVKIERMTQSREGMITAFYSYMKNPYATFSTGGRQSLPKSRDPKLLIAKSIREIATEQVRNRLRSVSV